MSELPSIPSFLGIRNKLDVRRFPAGALQEAVNIDVDDSGEIVRRFGYAADADLALTNITASYTTIAQDQTYVVDDGVLKRINADKSIETLASGVSSIPAYWTELGTRIICSLGYIIDMQGAAYAFAIDTPPPPTVVKTIGSLFAGQYQVVLTATSSDGRESQSSPATIVDLDTAGGLMVQDSGYNVYCTDVNGDEFFYCGTSPVIIGGQDALTRILIEPDLFQTLPAPDNMGPVAIYDTMLFMSVYDNVTDISTIWVSKSYRWHVFDPYNESFAVDGKVRMLTPAHGALLIGTDKQLFAYDGAALTALASYGVPQGQPSCIDRDGMVYIWTARGACRALPFENLTDSKVSLPPGDYVHTAIVEQNGMKKFVVLTDNGGLANNPRN